MNRYEQRFVWNLDWNLLRTFMVVVEQKGISRAADFLGLKQPTISSALRRLEETTGQRLVNRKPNRFQVTDAGRVLYAECAAIFGSVAQLPALMEADQKELSGHIGFVLASHVVSPHFDAVLEAYANRYPRVTFSMTVEQSGAVVTDILQNRASFGICLMNGGPGGLERRVLFREFFGLYCGPRHRLFGRNNIAIGELADEPSVAFQTENDGGPLVSVGRLRERAGLAAGLNGQSSSLAEVRRMIVANIGIGALPVHVARKDVRLGELWQVPPFSQLPMVEIFLVTNPRRSLPPHEVAFLEMIDEMLERVPMEERTYR
ncbi:LysR family transcriptional regulator [Seohaeicola nanhaiensis]|uniref:LysR family transcriptional regulator n=1 Tax=Seohaeicola nanhaiensis TaxID=1387282 RepID=A0ABV9KPM8_9RHOB